MASKIGKGKIKRYWLTTDPTDKQIRRRANYEYWNFRCPKCDCGCSGTLAGDKSKWREAISKGNYKYPFTNHVHCSMCGWEWYDPEYYFPLEKPK